MRIAGAQVLLTGSTGGLGRALVRHLTQADARLIVTGRAPDPLRDLAQASGAVPVVADLAETDDVRRLAARCADVDVLIANAALPASGDLLEYREDELRRAVEVNLVSVLQLVHLLAPRMVARGRGHIVVVGSMSGKAATPESALYTTTKFGLRGFALAIRHDLRRHGVGVSLVQPGFVADAGMFAATGAPLPRGATAVRADRVAIAVLRAIETGRAEVNVAPLALRAWCALYGVSPRLADGWRRLRSGAPDPAPRMIVDAQRARR
ncbi:SDR family NAD(P)-dependent oxidoreductase [Micromonospora sp. NPDC049645]|uniref:SDR family NAD(P)-dependent oxidoreductase n=1 Tax=Micromonospora sp. NPDC049645 TaxID=3155508 RepID=UPI0034209D05